MFDKKEKVKFYAELLRNLGTALIAGAYITLISSDNFIYNALIRKWVSGTLLENGCQALFENGCQALF